MNILLVSECTKNALKETRRIIDQFAERTGQRAWQTPITQKGLETLQGLLRKTARKNTAVACFWTRGKNQTELLWVVGDRSQFNERGRVPTNRTKRDIIRATDENSWKDGVTIQILATLAALLHDLGKATKGFQNKLQNSIKGKGFDADPYRHEWISLQLFKLMIKECDTNEALLERLANFGTYQKSHPDWYRALTAFDNNDKDKGALDNLPPIGQLIGWLIVSHHRMPFGKNLYFSDQTKLRDARLDDEMVEDFSLAAFYEYEMVAHDRWVKNIHSEHKNPQDFWHLLEDVTQSICWQKSLARWANKGLKHLLVVDNPLIYYLARLSLMVGDHNFSSYTKERSDNYVKGDNSPTLIANTERKRRESTKAKQNLDQHLLGVAQLTALFSRRIAALDKELPTLPHHRYFTKRVRIDKFRWQDRAYDLASSLQEKSVTAGFFGVNMASTGCGKTIGNARILYALADPDRGARFTIALGLRVLTLQTGKALREKLHLSDQYLATLVGGTATKALFELSEKERQAGEEKRSLSSSGSESLEALIEGEIDSSYLFSEFTTLIEDKKSHQLINTPIISCTIDHLISASENGRGSSHIAPILRLLSSDLILDEPDDFSQEDLPALARLIHLAGMFGARILLSSATLPPDLVAGLYDAYRAGREIWNRSHHIESPEIVCAWFDEFDHYTCDIKTSDDYGLAHDHFLALRINQLRALREKKPRRSADILMIEPSTQREVLYKSLAHKLLEQAVYFHIHHHTVEENSGKNVSIGLIRIANIKHIIRLARAFYKVENLANETEFHIAVYHSRQLLVLRNGIEERLDKILDRHNPLELFTHKEIRERIEKSGAKNHLFIVLGSPVTEVGRDHDYDWAIVEPSSMRSIIQIAGRVWRHREKVIDKVSNMAVLSSNINSLLQGETLGVGHQTFAYPGFEVKGQFLLASHHLEMIIKSDQLAVIDSTPRIERSKIILEEGRYRSLSDLEHGVMGNYFNLKNPNFVTSFWQEGLAHHAHNYLRVVSPFRRDKEGGKEEIFICQLEEDGSYCFRSHEVVTEYPTDLTIGRENALIKRDHHGLESNCQIKPWLALELKEVLENLGERLGREDINELAKEFSSVNLKISRGGDVVRAWSFHPWLGFWEE